VARKMNTQRGLPVKGDVEHVDELALGRALDGRREVAA
jgi:recombinational DNA repair protein RecR